MTIVAVAFHQFRALVASLGGPGRNGGAGISGMRGGFRAAMH